MNWLHKIFGFSSIGELITSGVCEWLAGLVNELFAAFDAWLANMLRTVMYVENLVSLPGSSYFTAEGIHKAYLFIYAFTCTLIVIKFLYKGFNIYVLWRDGDADTSPQSMLIGAGEALFVMVAFPILYDYLTDAALYFANGIMRNFGQYGTLVPNLFVGIAESGLLLILLALIYGILLIFLWLQLLARGFEVLIMRLGVPLACVGLVDSDGGLFHGYMQIFFKTIFTTIVQIFFFSLSFKVMTAISFLNFIYGIALLLAAFKTPLLLQNILVQAKGAGGGVTSKIYAGGMAAQSIRRLLGK